MNILHVVIPRVVLLVFSVASIVLITLGVIKHDNRQKKVSSLKKIDPTNFFTLEPNSCTVVSSSITSITKRRTVRNSYDPDRIEDYCEDSVFYTFVWNDAPEDVKNVTSRTFVSVRNVRQMYTEHPDELCIATSDNGLIPYQGFLKEDTPFVCEGLCDTGTVVDCWRPKADVCSTAADAADNDCSEKIDWAVCGNLQCLKLVDPEVELSMAIYDDGDRIEIPYLVFGVVFGFPATARLVGIISEKIKAKFHKTTGWDVVNNGM